MIALDTNVLVRFFVRDDPSAYGMAEALLTSKNVSVSPTVVLETEWVLRSSYEFSKADVHSALAALLALPNVLVQERQAVMSALEWSGSGLDFPDALHLALAGFALAGVAKDFATFDTDLIRKAARLKHAIPVSSPRQLLR